MRQDEAFLADIVEHPDDDAPRLVYADWLEDHGDPERAEFIRTQCELEPIRDRYEIARAPELHSREEELLRKHRKIVWFIMTILAAVMAPGDIVTSMLALLIPLVFLYEFGIWLALWSEKKRAPRERQEAA